MFEKELEVALKAAKQCVPLILEIYNSDNIGLEIKEDNSPVTKADKVADNTIRKILHEAFPSYALLTEESEDDKSRLSNDYVWIVDPIDGTKEFVAHSDEFTINIGLSYKHEPVLGVILIPVTGEIYYAVKGQGSFYQNGDKTVKIHVNSRTNDLTTLVSRFHSNEDEQAMIAKHSDRIKHQRVVGSSIKGCVIAKGEAEMSYRFSSNTKEWDTCAMQTIVEEAGGLLLKFTGERILYNREDVYNRGGYVICNCRENFLI